MNKILWFYGMDKVLGFCTMDKMIAFLVWLMYEAYKYDKRHHR